MKIRGIYMVYLILFTQLFILENDEIVDQITTLTENEGESVLTSKQEFRKQIEE